MKLAFTISDFGAAANIGGDVERRTFIVEIDDNEIPTTILHHLKKDGNKWSTLSISAVDDEMP